MDKQSNCLASRAFCGIVILAACLFAAVPATAQSRPPKVALVLSGGSALGIAHVGVLKVLEQAGIPIDMVLGTSMGSIVGGLYAAGYSPDELETIVTTQDWQAVLMDRKDSPRDGYDEAKRRHFAMALGFDKDGVRLGSGLLEGQNVLSLFTQLTLHALPVRDFDDFPVPYRAVAAEILTGKKVVFSSGSIAEAMRASMSIPALFRPYEVGGLRLVDGGIVDNMPVDVAREMGADIVIAVESRLGNPSGDNSLKSALSIAGHTASLFIEQNMLAARADADLFLAPDLAGYSVASYNEAEGIVRRGAEGALARLPDIEALAARIALDRPLVKPEAQANRKARKDPPLVASYVVEGGSEGDRVFAHQIFDPLAGPKVDPVLIRKAIDAAYSSGRFDLVKFDLRPGADGAVTGVVRLVPDSSSENAALLGFDYRGLVSTSVSGHLVLTPAIILRDLTTKDSALFAEASLVDSARAYIEFFQPLGPLYFQPWARYTLENDTYDFDESAFSLGVIYRSLGAGMWAGASIGRHFDVLAGYSFENVKPGSSTAVNLGEAKVAFNLDTRDRTVFTTRGVSALLLGRWADPAFGSQISMARAEFEGSVHSNIGKTLNVGVSAFAGTDFSGLVPGAKEMSTSYFFGLRRPGMFYGYQDHSERGEGDHVAALSLELRARLGRLVELIGGDMFAFANGSAGTVRVGDGRTMDFLPLRTSFALGAGARMTDSIGILAAVCMNYDQGAATPLTPAFTIEFGSFSSRFENRR
jgi:NTE family protein